MNPFANTRMFILYNLSQIISFSRIFFSLSQHIKDMLSIYYYDIRLCRAILKISEKYLAPLIDFNTIKLQFIKVINQFIFKTLLKILKNNSTVNLFSK